MKAVLCLSGEKGGGQTWLSKISSRKLAEKRVRVNPGRFGSTGFSFIGGKGKVSGSSLGVPIDV